MLWSALFASLISTAEARDFSEVFEQVEDAVVVIETLGTTAGRNGRAQTVLQEGLGSGVIINQAGDILTAAHVVQESDRVSVRLSDGRSIKAKVVLSDPSLDLALIRLDELPRDLKTVHLADSDEAKVGEEVFIIGAPYGAEYTLSVGHLTAHRTVPDLFSGFRDWNLLQTDAVINEGNSGGPLFNVDGEVIGIVSHIVSPTGSHSGIGFAVSANTAREALLEHQPKWTGSSSRYLDAEMAHILNIPQAGGLLVEHVSIDSPAAQMGLRGGDTRVVLNGNEYVLGGDIILSIADLPITSAAIVDTIRTKIEGLKPGSKYVVEILRDGKVEKLRARTPKE